MEAKMIEALLYRKSRRAPRPVRGSRGIGLYRNRKESNRAGG